MGAKGRLKLCHKILVCEEKRSSGGGKIWEGRRRISESCSVQIYGKIIVDNQLM